MGAGPSLHVPSGPAPDLPVGLGLLRASVGSVPPEAADLPSSQALFCLIKDVSHLSEGTDIKTTHCDISRAFKILLKSG